jgi:hypothetical protein
MPLLVAGRAAGPESAPLCYVVVVHASRDGGHRWTEFTRVRWRPNGPEGLTETIHGHLALLRREHPRLLFQAEAFHPGVQAPARQRR